MPDPSAPCPCGRTLGKNRLSYARCCGRYLDHFDSTPAPDAESLMRSRYTAFVLERGQYLLDTWCAAHRPVVVDFDRGAKWLGLAVRRHRQIDPNHAEVEFVARNRMNGRASRLHEISRFSREGDRWVYVDGDIRGGREGV
ncbi:MAG: YchJ family metal-binding protein [Burkholderiales bacterium]